MTQETLMMEQPTATTEASASTEADQIALEAQAPGVAEPAQEQQSQGDGQQDGTGAEKQVPEQYADFSFEGDKALDTDLADDIKATAKDLGLTQSQAQKLADLAMKRTESAEAQQAERLAAVRVEWEGQAKADKEFGGEKLAENLSAAKRALDAFATPEFKTLLNESGLGNHPEVIRFCYRAGKAISEDRIVTGGAGATQRSDARSLYSASNMNP